MTRCPHFKTEFHGNCDFNEPQREHSDEEIAAVLRIPIREARRVHRAGIAQFRVRVATSHQLDGLMA